MTLVNGAQASNIYWALGAYFEANSGSQSYGTFLAQSYVTLTSASVTGAVFSLHAATTLTVSSVRLPGGPHFSHLRPPYNTPVDMRSTRLLCSARWLGPYSTAGPSRVDGNVACILVCIANTPASIVSLPLLYRCLHRYLQ